MFSPLLEKFIFWLHFIPFSLMNPTSRAGSVRSYASPGFCVSIPVVTGSLHPHPGGLSPPFLPSPALKQGISGGRLLPPSLPPVLKRDRASGHSLFPGWFSFPRVLFLSAPDPGDRSRRNVPVTRLCTTSGTLSASRTLLSSPELGSGSSSRALGRSCQPP